MKKLIFVLIIIDACVFSSLWAIDNNVSNFPQLTLIVSLEKKEFSLGHAVELILECTNSSSQIIHDVPPLRAKYYTGYEHLRLYVKKASNDFVEVAKFLSDAEQVDAHCKEGDFTVQFRDLAPRAILKEQVSLEFDWFEHPPRKLFPTAGAYQIKAVLYDKDHSQSVMSNVVTVNISEGSFGNQVKNATNGRGERASAQQPLSNKLLDKTVRGLETEWFDVNGFLKSRSKESQQYWDEVQQLFEQMGVDEKISEEEFDRKTAELLKSYVKKYCKPLPPEEWKKRYAAYEAEANTEVEKKKAAEVERRRKYGAIDDILDNAFTQQRTQEGYFKQAKGGLGKLLAESKDEDLKKKTQETLAELEHQAAQQALKKGSAEQKKP